MSNYFSYMKKALANPNVKIRMATEVEQRQLERRARVRYLNSWAIVPIKEAKDDE